ncbi:hypothetical protein D9756_003891 [Leucocoprinus leucothites]|uniref:Uncharacterized protein n=1 Tax=Leucocoprinus leucothites TaxID=201217 RepID=A0A8H5D9A1_9AGAR|nr:hypothetical protein D9756_003891 [Leucoagaricus leucothites]
MSVTESDQDYDNAKVDSTEMFEPDVDGKPSFSLDAILQILEDDRDAYSHSISRMPPRPIDIMLAIETSTDLSALCDHLDLIFKAHDHDSDQQIIDAFLCLGVVHALAPK